MEACLNHNNEIKNTWLQSQGYYEDVYDNFDNMSGSANE
jgi:hypothetical protein